ALCCFMKRQPRARAHPHLGHGRATVRKSNSPSIEKPLHERLFKLVGATGFEPATFRPPAECATRLRHAPWLWRHRSASERATGLEPAPRAWKALVRPLHHARLVETF